jgi:hypothetical protein
LAAGVVAPVIGAQAASADSPTATISISCSAVTYAYTGFPNTTNTIDTEQVTNETPGPDFGVVLAAKSGPAFTFTGSTGTDTISIAGLVTDGDTINGFASWTNPAPGDAATIQTLGGCGGSPPACQASSSNIANFNGTAIPAGDYIWFSAVMKVQGVGSSPVTIGLQNSTVQIGSTTYNVPNASTTIVPGGTSSSTSFQGGMWVTSEPTNAPGNVFLSGVAIPLLAGLPGGIHNVNWTATFTTTTPGINAQWQWAAAAYTSFSTNYSALGVKPDDSNNLSQYQNSDHAGTPENFKSYVTGGATGGGGSNFTGSYSGTTSVSPQCQSQVNAEQALLSEEGVISGAGLSGNTANQLVGQLQNAGQQLAQSNFNGACQSLGQFAQQVFQDTLGNNPGLTIAEAQSYLASANTIATNLGCATPTATEAAAEQSVLGLGATVNGLGVASNVVNDLEGPLQNSGNDLTKGNTNNVCSDLTQFAQKATQDSTGNNPGLTAAQAAALIANKQAIATTLGC